MCRRPGQLRKQIVGLTFGIAVFTGTALLANAALLAAAQIVPFFAFANVIVVLGPVVSADTAGAVRRVALLASV